MRWDEAGPVVVTRAINAGSATAALSAVGSGMLAFTGFVTSIILLINHPIWHERALTADVDRVRRAVALSESVLAATRPGTANHTGASANAARALIAEYEMTDTPTPWTGR